MVVRHERSFNSFPATAALERATSRVNKDLKHGLSSSSTFMSTNASLKVYEDHDEEKAFPVIEWPDGNDTKEIENELSVATDISIDKFLVAQGLKKETAKKKMLVSSASGDAAFNPPVRKSSRKDSRERQGGARCHWSHPCFNNLHFL